MFIPTFSDIVCMSQSRASIFVSKTIDKINRSYPILMIFVIYTDLHESNHKPGKAKLSIRTVQSPHLCSQS